VCDMCWARGRGGQGRGGQLSHGQVVCMPYPLLVHVHGLRVRVCVVVHMWLPQNALAEAGQGSLSGVGTQWMVPCLHR
jgi:hypothetical protein